MAQSLAVCPDNASCWPRTDERMIKDIAVEQILGACAEAKTLTLKPGEVLFREGDEANAMYVVKHGTLRILSGSTILETVREGGLIGEMAIIEEHMPRSATVIAIASWSRSTCRAFCRWSPARRISRSPCSG